MSANLPNLPSKVGSAGNNDRSMPLPSRNASAGHQALSSATTNFPAINPFGFPNQGASIHFHPGQIGLGVMSGPVSSGTSGMGMMLSPGLTQSPSGSSSFFHGWNLRSGKWLQEEEDFAEHLIDLFEKGDLSDCITGSTLRAYLAQKLHCAPMRISKKFAGKGIGKKVYNCRLDTRKTTPAQVAEQRRKDKEMVQEAEKKFHEAVASDGPKFRRSNQMRLIPGYMPFFAQTPNIPFTLRSMVGAQQLMSQLPQNARANNNHSMSGAPVLSANSGTSTMASVTCAGTASATQQLGGSLPKAVARHASSATGPPMQSKPHAIAVTASGATQKTHCEPKMEVSSGVPKEAPPNEVDPSSSQTANAASLDVTGMQPKPIVGAHARLPQMETMPCRQRGNATVQPHQYSGLKASHMPTSVLARHPGAEAKPQRSVGSIESPNFPDFMAGFDKVALNLKGNSGSHSSDEAQPQLQCSPPFTSRSFDDFHRFLGKDLSPLDDGRKAKDSHDVALRSDPHDKKFDRDTLFTAESYAMFAQESARAASQHAAYLTHDKIPPLTQTQKTERIGSFDFDRTMKLVSQHVSITPANHGTHLNKAETRTSALSGECPVHPRPGERDDKQCAHTRRSFFTQVSTTENSVAFVSGSEPTSSAAESSVRGSTSESNGSDNTFSNSDDGHFESGEDSHSSDDLSFDDTADSDQKGQSSQGSFSPGQVYKEGSAPYKRKLALDQGGKKKPRVSVEGPR